MMTRIWALLACPVISFPLSACESELASYLDTVCIVQGSTEYRELRKCKDCVGLLTKLLPSLQIKLNQEHIIPGLRRASTAQYNHAKCELSTSKVTIMRICADSTEWSHTVPHLLLQKKKFGQISNFLLEVD